MPEGKVMQFRASEKDINNIKEIKEYMKKMSGFEPKDSEIIRTAIEILNKDLCTRINDLTK